MGSQACQKFTIEPKEKKLYSGMLLLLFSFAVRNTKCHVFCRFVNEGFLFCTKVWSILDMAYA